MGTKASRQEKISYIKGMLAKSKESKKGYPRKLLVSRLIISYVCSLRTAEEIVQAFIDSKEAEEIEENKEKIIYG